MTRRLRTRVASAAVFAAIAVITTLSPEASSVATAAERVPVAAPAATATTSTALVLYDGTGPYAWLGGVYAAETANLVGHFGTATRKKVTDYVAGDVNRYTATIYLGSTYDEPLPTSFLSDVATTTRPVIWIGFNIWKLTAANPNFAATYGWMWSGLDSSQVTGVDYKGTRLTRSADNNSPIMNYSTVDPTKATILASAVKADGTKFPWAIHSKNLTYIGEMPYAYIGETDRYLAWSDILFNALAPSTPERHRALIRLEDIGPKTDAKELKAIVDYLYRKRIKFSMAVYTWYRDPLGTMTGGVPESLTLRQAPAVVSALKYAMARGGTIISHGRTHQLDSLINPYDAVSANDFEFYLAHVDASDRVVLDGPVPNDSFANAQARIQATRQDFLDAGITPPTIFEFPHYAGSEADYLAAKSVYPRGYDRRLYFPRTSAGAPDYTRPTGQFFPYDVVDVYGTRVIPENGGNFIPEPYNQHPAVLIPELINRARVNLVVRDGFASYFYHPYLGVAPLKELVDGVNAIGKYTWVGPNDI